MVEVEVRIISRLRRNFLLFLPAGAVSETLSPQPHARDGRAAADPIGARFGQDIVAKALVEHGGQDNSSYVHARQIW